MVFGKNPSNTKGKTPAPVAQIDVDNGQDMDGIAQKSLKTPEWLEDEI